MIGTLVRFAETNPDGTHKEVFYSNTRNRVEVSPCGVVTVRVDGYPLERSFAPQAWLEVVYDYELKDTR